MILELTIRYSRLLKTHPCTLIVHLLLTIKTDTLRMQVKLCGNLFSWQREGLMKFWHIEVAHNAENRNH